MTHSKRQRVMFLCTANSCRSQMAEGWARALLADQVDACSAGTKPHKLNPLAVRAMEEAGVDISEHVSKTIESCSAETLDLVVTVCGNAYENCPVFLTESAQTRVTHHGFDDPPELAKDAASDDDAMQHYRRVRDEIRAFIETLPTLLDQSMSSKGADRQ